jgi:hypothetical protein
MMRASMTLSEILGLAFPILVLLIAVPLLIWVLPDELPRMSRKKTAVSLPEPKKRLPEAMPKTEKKANGIRYILPSDVLSDKEKES